MTVALEEIKKELKIETAQPVAEAIYARKRAEGPGSTPRTKHLFQRCRWKNTQAGEYARPEIKVGLERARLYTEAHKADIGGVEIIKRAKCLAHYLENCTIFIQDDELLVGDHCETPDTIEIYPEAGFFPFIDMIESDMTPEECKEEGRQIADYWKPFGLQGKCEAYYERNELLNSCYSGAMTEAPPFVINYTSCVPPYMSILEDGLEKRVAWCEKNIESAMAKLVEYPWNGPEKLPLLHKIDVWRAMVIAGKAVIAWARRYSRLAKIIAENFDLSDCVEGAEQRKKELLEISDICWRVPAEPAKGFRDAMQSKWYCYQITQNIERTASGYPHLEDRLMWPYYKASVIDGTYQPMSRDEAIELLECERLKVCERGVGKGRVYREAQPGVNDLHIVTLGGLDVNDNDACTDLTDAILEASLNIHTSEPSLAFRYSPKINEKTRRLVYMNIAQGYGFPSIKHEEKNVRQCIEYYHWPKEEAYHWALILCMAPGVCRRRSTQKTRSEGGGIYHPAKCMELALSDGFDYSFCNEQSGPHTGDPTKFKTYEDVVRAFETQLKYTTSLFWRGKDITRWAEMQWMESPYLALMDDACVEKGQGAFEEKAWPNPWSDSTSPQSVGDDLASIKYWVFDKKKYTLEQLVTALRANWEGYEEMRRDFLAAPKWGNDDDYVDKIQVGVYDMFSDILDEQVGYSGMSPLHTPQSVGLYAALAPRVGASPFGRKHGEVLHDGGISPYMGLDKKGPTAVLKSVSKVNHDRCKGIQLNQRLPVSVMREDEKGFDLWTAYMAAWHDLNIDHVQFNVVSSEDMRAAQREPEKWQELIVRIAGYSARFVTLPKNTQDSIIARTVQEMG